MRFSAVFAAGAMLIAAPSAAWADHMSTGPERVLFDFAGNGGFGLLPGNEVGDNTAAADTSDASGDEVGVGLVYERDSQLLNIEFEFSDLTGGLLTAAASGIHLHLPTMPGDPFNQLGPIVFNLNSFADPAVTNFNDPIADGATSGAVSAVISFADSPELIDDLLAGEFYLNIHTAGFSGGELRGSITRVPEPASLALIAALGSAGVFGRRRR